MSQREDLYEDFDQAVRDHEEWSGQELGEADKGFALEFFEAGVKAGMEYGKQPH
jgi:hypothetical protein